MTDNSDQLSNELDEILEEFGYAVVNHNELSRTSLQRPYKAKLLQLIEDSCNRAFLNGRAGEAAWWRKNHADPDYKEVMERRYQRLLEQAALSTHKKETK